MHQFGVTFTYDELLHFKRSAATCIAQSKHNCNILDCGDGLVQIVGDNFDTNISSPNGKLSTHSLALLIMQPDKNDDEIQIAIIRRLSKNEMVDPVPYNVDIALGQRNLKCPRSYQ